MNFDATRQCAKHQPCCITQLSYRTPPKDFFGFTNHQLQISPCLLFRLYVGPGHNSWPSTSKRVLFVCVLRRQVHVKEDDEYGRFAVPSLAQMCRTLSGHIITGRLSLIQLGTESVVQV